MNGILEGILYRACKRQRIKDSWHIARKKLTQKSNGE
jgi:hypothetical protein